MMEESSLELNLQEVSSELDCPICMETFSPPVYQCTSGHSICSPCRSKIQNCPNCENAFTGARNFTLEKILESFQKRCKYFHQGCPEILKIDLYRSHVKICDYRPLKCLFCDQEGINYKELLQHLEAEHVDQIHPSAEATSNSFSLDYSVHSNDLPELIDDDGCCLAWEMGWFKFNDGIIFEELRGGNGFLNISLWKYPNDTKSPGTLKLWLNEKLKFSWHMELNSYRNTGKDILANGTVAPFPVGAVVSKVDAEDDRYSFKVTFELDEE